MAEDFTPGPLPRFLVSEAYAKLIDLCDVHKLRVGLIAGRERRAVPGTESRTQPECFRDLEALTVAIGAGATLRERVDADLDVCASRLLRRLRSIPRFAGG